MAHITQSDLHEFLAPILVHQPSAIIAGGAVRDMILAIDVHDIDVYVQADDNNTTDEYWSIVLRLDPITDIIRCMGEDCTHDTAAFDDQLADIAAPEELIHHEALDTNIRTVFEGTCRDMQFNIILVDSDPVYHVKEYFDIGLCKAYYDGNAICTLPEFMHDVNQQTFTICCTHMTASRLLHIIETHVWKLQQKFPGFTTIISEYNQQYVDQ